MCAGRAHYRQYIGLFTRRKIEEIYNLSKDYTAKNSENLPWCCMDVQGFYDSPVSWNLKEHTFYVDGDNSYTILRSHGNEKILLQKSKSSNNKPRII